jgi:hypothetical protein
MLKPTSKQSLIIRVTFEVGIKGNLIHAVSKDLGAMRVTGETCKEIIPSIAPAIVEIYKVVGLDVVVFPAICPSDPEPVYWVVSLKSQIQEYLFVDVVRSKLKSNVFLYEPCDDGEIPRKIIGKAHISNDLWQQITGTGEYAGRTSLRNFRLQFREQLFASGPSAGSIPETMTTTSIDCLAIPVYKHGRDTFDSVIVVPNLEDRRRVYESKDGVWCG